MTRSVNPAGAERGRRCSRNSLSSSSVRPSIGSTTAVLLQSSLRFVAQQSYGALQVASHRRQRHAELNGDVLRLQVFLVPQQHDGSLRRWKREQQLLHAVHQRKNLADDGPQPHAVLILLSRSVAARGPPSQ